MLTASGGPFRGRRRAELADVTPEQALAHPTWDMGPVVTINSATLVNKGLELIEAHLLFGVPYDRIDVVVHPQSVVHSMVTFADGSTLAQASPPDMRLPIALALGWPERVDGAAPACRWDVAQAWTFEPLDHDAFRGVAAGAARPGRRAGACRRCSTPRTRRPSPRSSRAGWASPTSPGSSRTRSPRPTAGGRTRRRRPTSPRPRSGPGRTPARRRGGRALSCGDPGGMTAAPAPDEFG